MPQTCTVCRHAARVAIDATLTQGTPLQIIADRYGVSKSALLRHRQHGHGAFGNSCPCGMGYGHQTPRLDWPPLVADAVWLHQQALATRDLTGAVVALRGVTTLLLHVLTLRSGASPEA
jgi:hypothetical protein